MSKISYPRILLKLSGEALRGNQTHGFDEAVLKRLGDQLAELYTMGVIVGLVIGGGNFIRGGKATADLHWFSRDAADNVGMMATVMNGIALRELLLSRQIPCKLLSAVEIAGVVESYNPIAMRQAIASQEILIFVGGTGHPFFTTDTTAALRAQQMGANLLIKATQVDGVYDADPQVYPEAKRYSHLTYLQVLANDLRVMDATSISFCREYQIPIMVVDIGPIDNLKRVVLGEAVGTLIDHHDPNMGE
jgi:uridylate kinase